MMFGSSCIRITKILPILFFLLGALNLTSQICEAKVKKRFEIPFSLSATYRGHTQGALYVLDADSIRQYNETGLLRKTMRLSDGQEFICSPEGYFYALIDSDTNASGSRPFTHYNVYHQRLYQGELPPGARLYLGDRGRHLSAVPTQTGKVNLFMYDSLGAQTGEAYAPACDTVVFAPGGRGVLLGALDKGLHYFLFSGEKIATYPQADRFAFSLSGRKVITARQGVIMIYNRNEIATSFRIPKGSVRRLIYVDSKGIVYVLTATRLYRVNSTNGIVQLDYPVIGEGRTFTDLGYSAKSNLLIISILVSKGSQVARERRALESAVRVLTPDGIEEPYYYVRTEATRKGFPMVHMGSSGFAAIFISADQIHRVGWEE